MIHNLCPEIRPHWQIWQKIRDYLLILLLFCALYSYFFDAMHCKHIWNITPITTEWVRNLWDVPLSISSGSCWLFFFIWRWYINALRSPLAAHSYTYVTATQIFYRLVISREDFKSFQEARQHPFTMSSTVWSLKSSPSTSLSLLYANIAFDLTLEWRKS